LPLLETPHPTTPTYTSKLFLLTPQGGNLFSFYLSISAYNIAHPVHNLYV